MRITRSSAAIAAMLVGAAAAGCASKPAPMPAAPPTVDVLTMTVRTGGTHHCTLMHDEVWYQSYDSRLLVLDPQSGFILNQINFGRPGHSPPVIDMVIHRGSMYVVLEADSVLRLSLAAPEEPAVVETIETSLLGVQPLSLSVVDGRLFASGEGGVVDLDARALVQRTAGRAGRVVRAAEGLATTVEGRVVNLGDGGMLGLGTDVLTIPPSYELDGRLIGLRQRESAAMISLLSPEAREELGEYTTIALPGVTRRIRFFDGNMWVVHDDGIRVCRVTPAGIEITRTIDVLGARDVARRDDNHLVVAGAFGRAIYRENANEEGPGDEFIRVHREPSGLTNVVTDGRYLLAGGPLGHWRYLIGQDHAELNEREITQSTEPARRAQMPGASIEISEDGYTATVDADGVLWHHEEPGEVKLHCVSLIDNRFWVGHDRGITVLRALRPRPVVPADPALADPAALPVEEPARELGRLRFEGPVRFILPLASGRGAAFVSEFGGFGVAEFRSEELE